MDAHGLVESFGRGTRMFLGLELEPSSDLSHTELGGITISESSLPGLNLSQAVLEKSTFEVNRMQRADASGAFLYRTTFFDDQMQGARFDEATLMSATFKYCDLSDASLQRAQLVSTIFEDCVLAGANFDGASLGSTCFIGTDLSPLCEAKGLVHQGPSVVDFQSLVSSYQHPGLKRFLVESGVPGLFADYMIDGARAVGESSLRSLMRSTFISYGGPDEPFARRLYKALQENGVVTFFFPETARLGERIGNEVFRRLQEHDRVVLICSRASLDRPGVLNEVQETFDREARDGGATYLLPVTLDDYVFTGWEPVGSDLGLRLKQRVVGDFRGADEDPAIFDRQLSRLLEALKTRKPLNGRR